MPCTFNLDVPHLSHLDSTHPTPKGPPPVLKKNTTLPLPLWLSEILAVAETVPPLVTLDLPSALGPPVLNALKAGATSVDLRVLASHYHALGARVLELFEEEEVLEVLTESWRRRAAMVADFAARGGRGAEGVEFLRGLDEWERGLWAKNFEGSKRMRAWLEGKKV